MRWAFKVAYLGGEYAGYARQPGHSTVEGDLVGILQGEGFLEEPGARFQTASRTDRGVSALGNVVAFSTDAHPREVIAGVNRRSAPLWLHGYAGVPGSFNPRHAEERWYRYHLPAHLERDRLDEGARALLGRHPFPGLSRGHGGTSTVHSIAFATTRGWIAMDIRADRFLRSMVRRIAQALTLYADGSLTLPEIVRARDKGEVGVAVAPAEPLVLMDVSYGFPFQAFVPSGTPADVATIRSKREMEVTFISLLQEWLCS